MINHLSLVAKFLNFVVKFFLACLVSMIELRQEHQFFIAVYNNKKRTKKRQYFLTDFVNMIFWSGKYAVLLLNKFLKGFNETTASVYMEYIKEIKCTKEKKRTIFQFWILDFFFLFGWIAGAEKPILEIIDTLCPSAPWTDYPISLTRHGLTWAEVHSLANESPWVGIELRPAV